MAGVDGCRRGWAAVVVHGGRAELHVVPRFADVVELAAVVAVDMPIGLPDGPARACDVEARRRLGWPRRASVFPHLPRLVLDAGSHADAVARCRAAGRPAVSVQAWNLRAKVAEVDAALDRPGVVVVEAHPEVTFAAMAGRPMAASKRTAAGRAERLAVLDDRLPGAPALLAARPPGAAADDVLDAAALSWTAARVAAGTAETLGDGAPDALGRPQRIWV